MKGKKATKRALLSSALSLVLCFSMLLGTTFAWFTDEASTAVNTIQSGTLNVDLVAEDGVTSLDGETLSFQNFGTDPSDGDYWEPNCTYFTQGFKVANLGNLWLKYQLAIGGITGDLMLLDVVDFYLTTDVSSVEAAKANRVEIDTFVDKLAPETSSEPYYLVGHMDMDAGNEYQNKTLNNIAVTVFATQEEAEFDSFGNNYDADANPNDFYCDILATPETIERILAEAEEGTIIGLAGGEYGSLKITQHNLTLISNGSAVVDYIDLNAKDGTIIDGLTFNADNAGIAYSYNRKQGAFTDTGYTTSINDASAKEGTNIMAADDTVIRNCTFTGNGDDSKYIPVHFNAVSRTSDSLVNVTVDNNVFACNALQYLKLDYIHGEVIVTNNTFGGVGYGTGHNGINATSNSANWTITGNAFWKWNAANAAFGSSRSSADGVITITVKNNEFYNTSAEEIPVLNLKNSYAAGNFALNYSGNTANYGTYTLAAVGEPVGASDVYYYMTKDATSDVKIVAPGVVETATRTYEVYGAEGLMNVNTVINTVTHGEGMQLQFKLMTDVDMSGYDWTPLHLWWVSFDGNDKTVSNLNCIQGTSGKSGFAGYLTSNLSNLTLENVTAAGCQAGAFAGQTEGGTITNCVLKGDNTITWEQNTTSSHVEDHNAIGAIIGHCNSATVSGVEIAEGATVTLNKGTMTTVCSRSDKLVSGCGTPTGTVTNNGTVSVNVTASTDEALDAAISGGADVVVLGSGTYIIPDSAQGKTLTITGNGDTVVATQDDGSYEGCDYSLDGATVTFNNITINTDSTTYTGYARCNGTYNNCTINGTYTLYGNSVFNNCTFNVTGDVYNIWTWGAPTATFKNCTFNSDGKAMLLYGTADTKLTIDGCTFNDNGGLTDKKAAIEIGNDYGKSYELIVNNTTVNGYEINDKGINTGTTLWGNKNSMGTDKLNVVVDGVDVY